MEKIEKLELKHLCGYLPHGLQCQYVHKTMDGFIVKDKVFILDSFMQHGVWKYWTHDQKFLKHVLIGKGFRSCDFKPLLLPLSALTEPMEDGTVPIVELAKIELLTKKCQIGDLYNVESFKLLKDHFCEFYEEEDSYTRYWFQYNEVNGFSKQIVINGDFESTFCNISIDLFEYLYSKHFDIYGLIPAGLAIDKRTVKL